MKCLFMCMFSFSFDMLNPYPIMKGKNSCERQFYIPRNIGDWYMNAFQSSYSYSSISHVLTNTQPGCTIYF